MILYSHITKSSNTTFNIDEDMVSENMVSVSMYSAGKETKNGCDVYKVAATVYTNIPLRRPSKVAILPSAHAEVA